MRKYSECQIKGCDREHKAHGWCKLHYDRWKKNGHPLVTSVKRPTEKTPKNRFYSYVSLPNEDGCMLWTGPTVGGYGIFSIGYKRTYAHRMAYQLLVGPIPEGLQLDHVKAWGCRSTLCVSPNHLEPVTPAENNRRSNSVGAINRKKTHCPEGHPYDEANTRIYKGGRYCRACRREHAKKYRNSGYKPKQEDADTKV